jgi:hypothetical protein
MSRSITSAPVPLHLLGTPNRGRCDGKAAGQQRASWQHIRNFGADVVELPNPAAFHYICPDLLTALITGQMQWNGTAQGEGESCLLDAVIKCRGQS